MEIPDYEQRLDQVFLVAFSTNHPAMLDWVQIKFELKSLRAKSVIEPCVQGGRAEATVAECASGKYCDKCSAEACWYRAPAA